MPSREQHCIECLYKMNDEFEYVHDWLDEFAQKMGPKHRLSRHHKEGVEEVRGKWGDQAAKAAEMHIVADVGVVVSRSDLRAMWKKSHPYKRDFQDFNNSPLA